MIWANRFTRQGPKVLARRTARTISACVAMGAVGSQGGLWPLVKLYFHPHGIRRNRTSRGGLRSCIARRARADRELDPIARHLRCVRRSIPAVGSSACPRLYPFHPSGFGLAIEARQPLAYKYWKPVDVRYVRSGVPDWHSEALFMILVLLCMP